MTLADFIANIPFPEGPLAGPVNLALVATLGVGFVLALWPWRVK